MFSIETNDRGVSPVIGVILMVAITVILAAVIGTFVLNLTGNMEQNPQASVTFDENGDQVTVQAISLQNADSVSLSRSDQSGYSATFDNVGDSATVGDATAQSTETLATGASTDDVALANGATVTVTATLDGNKAVIQTFTNN